MADDKGNPIARELAPSPPAHEPMAAEARRGCVACGRYHGSEGGGKACLEAEIKRLRAMLRDFPAHAETLRGYRSGVAKALSLGATAACLDALEALLKKDGVR